MGSKYEMSNQHGMSACLSVGSYPMSRCMRKFDNSPLMFCGHYRSMFSSPPCTSSPFLIHAGPVPANTTIEPGCQSNIKQKHGPDLYLLTFC